MRSYFRTFILFYQCFRMFSLLKDIEIEFLLKMLISEIYISLCRSEILIKIRQGTYMFHYCFFPSLHMSGHPRKGRKYFLISY